MTTPAKPCYLMPSGYTGAFQANRAIQQQGGESIGIRIPQIKWTC